MHNSVLLALWAGISFVLYKIACSIIVSRKRAATARQLGCLPAPPLELVPFDPLGIHNIAILIQADKNSLVPQWMEERHKRACAKAGREITTFHQNVMGGENYFTIEPKNIQAILATQFKDFGLGIVRNRNFSPLLGHGIVSGKLGIFNGMSRSLTVYTVLYRWRAMGRCKSPAPTPICPGPSQ